MWSVQKTKHTRSARAGLQFSVAKAEMTCRAQHARIGAGAPVYLAAVMEYISAEILELSGQEKRESLGSTKLQIQVCDVHRGIENDMELRSLFLGTELRRGLLPRLCPGPNVDEHQPDEKHQKDDDDSDEEEDEEEEMDEEEELRFRELEAEGVDTPEDGESSSDEDEEARQKEEEGWYEEADEQEPQYETSSDSEDSEDEGERQRHFHGDEHADAHAVQQDSKEGNSTGVIKVLDELLDPERVLSGRGDVYRVLKQVHPGVGIGDDALELVVQLVQHLGDTIAGKASHLAQYVNSTTLNSREIQTAVRLMLPGELAKHAVSEGTKAVTKWSCR